MEKKKGMKKKIKDMGKWLYVKKFKALAAINTFIMASMPCMVFADDKPAAGSPEAKWDAVINFMVPWISRLGGVVILIGAVEFGLGFKNDDAEAKTKGMRTVIAGCIVFAVGKSSSTFLT